MSSCSAPLSRSLRHCFKVFARYKGRRKATVFGSAPRSRIIRRISRQSNSARRMRDAGWMVVTGAGAGIMEAGHVGAGREDSIGLNILLPFEQSANTVIVGNEKLMTMQLLLHAQADVHQGNRRRHFVPRRLRHA